jgi:hypothetical protein
MNKKNAIIITSDYYPACHWVAHHLDLFLQLQRVKREINSINYLQWSLYVWGFIQKRGALYIQYGRLCIGRGGDLYPANNFINENLL